MNKFTLNISNIHFKCICRKILKLNMCKLKISLKSNIKIESLNQKFIIMITSILKIAKIMITNLIFYYAILFLDKTFTTYYNYIMHKEKCYAIIA